ncbi:MAG: endolytic transglycosylase MltG [Thermomicrobiales bacterium]
MVRIVLQALKIVTISVVAVLIVAGGARAFDYYLDEQKPNDIGRRYTFTVGDEDTIEDVTRGLKDRELIRYEWTFEGFVRVKNADLVPGRYELKKGMSAEQIADILTGGSTATASTDESQNEEEEEANEEEAETVQLTVPEGFRTEQIAERLVEIGWNGTADEFMAAVEEFPTDNFDFLESRENEVNPGSLEGFLFPDTYDVRTDEPAQDIIQKMLIRFDEQFTPQMRQRAEEMGLSVYQVLTFASLIEREARVAEERPIIADVFLKRWSEDWSLDSDPSVRYAFGKQDGEWWAAPSPEQLETTDSPYNTYLNAGLPPGPICNPSLDSIQAMLTPAESPFWYFVAHPDESGRHLFAADDASHQQNIAFYAGEADAPAPGSDPFESTQVTDQGGGEGEEELPIESTGG